VSQDSTLRLLAALVAPKQTPPAKASRLGAWLQKTAMPRRARAVVTHLLDGRTEPASLGAVVAWLETHAGELRVAALREVLSAALAAEWSLDNALPHLRRGPVFGVLAPFLEADAGGPSPVLPIVEHDGWRVALHNAPGNLAERAFRQGADVYLGRGPHVVRLQVAPWLTLATPALPGWSRPTPTLALLRGVSPSAAELLALVSDALQEAS
jgi:hypothetical protein